MKPNRMYFSECNDPIPNGEKPSWISLKTGELIDSGKTIIPPGFNRWIRDRPASRAIVMIVLCTIGQYRFKCSMSFLATKCDMTPRNLRRCLAELESGGWIIRKSCKRGGTLWGWNLFVIPHILANRG